MQTQSVDVASPRQQASRRLRGGPGAGHLQMNMISSLPSSAISDTCRTRESIVNEALSAKATVPDSSCCRPPGLCARTSREVPLLWDGLGAFNSFLT